MPDQQTAPTTEAKPAAQEIAKPDQADIALEKAMKAAGEPQTSLAPAVEKPDAAASPAPRDDKGRFVSSSATTEEGESAPAAAHSDDDIRRAVTAAQRDTAPKAILKAIEAGDSDTIAHYLKRAKVQDDGDSFSKTHKQLQQEFDSLKSKPAANSAGKSASDATASALDLDAAVKPLASHLAEVLGDDNNALAGKVRESFAALHGQFSKTLEQRDQQVEALQKQLDNMAVTQARDALLSDYPDLKDREVWSRVRKQYDTLPESADRPDTYTRLEHAARIELAPDLAKRAREERERRNKMRDDGAPTSTARNAAATKPSVNHGDLEDQYIDAQLRGDEAGLKEIKALMKSRTLP